MKSNKRVEQVNRIIDRLYGEISFTRDDLALFQTREMARLRQVSLSAVAPWILPVGVCASRFEHSAGVASLAKIVGDKSEFEDVSRELFVAGLAHDIGTPPFSHASELFLEKLVGVGHEEFARQVMEGSEFAREAKKQGVDLEKVLSYIEGNDQPVSDIINGSIDVDNLDNSLRFGLSMGIVQGSFYDPRELANSYRMVDGELVLLEPAKQQLIGWELVREQVYDYVYSQMNLASGVVLVRAMDFAYREGELTQDYFYLTDNQAFEYLATKCNSRTRKLIEWARCWVFFPKVYEMSTEKVPKDKQKGFMDAFSRGELADQLAEAVGVEPEKIAVYLGQNKGYKKIHLPIMELGGEVREHVPYNIKRWRAQVYVHPDIEEKASEVSEAAQELISELMN